MAKLQTLCRRLWRPSTPGGRARTPHLLQRQGERDISDAELAAAVKYGSRRRLPGVHGNVSYTHKGVVYVATPNGVGLTAFRSDSPSPSPSLRGKTGDNENDQDRSSKQLQRDGLNDHRHGKKE